MTEPDAWRSLPILTGAKVQLVPLALEHAGGYFRATGTPEEAAELFRWMPVDPPESEAQAAAQIQAHLEAAARAERFAYAQLDAATGDFAGMTTYYDVNPALRTIAIGHTWLGPRWWRTGHNTESKLLLLTRAFDTLRAVRVVWHTDIYNLRSQAAIERLGAVREGVLRKHRIRTDGSWRDTVTYSMTDDEWPAAADHLRARLARD